MTIKNLKYINQMKAQSITTILIAVLVLTACGAQQDGLDAKKQELTEARQQLKDIRTKIADLEDQIAEEDPTYFNGNEAAALVTTINIDQSLFEHKIEVRGNVLSRTNVYVSAEASGLLKELRIKEGQTVKKGQVLAIIDSEQIEKQIDEVKTRLEYATTIFEKRERLWKKNIGTEVDYLTAKNEKESLEKQLSSLNTQLSKTNIVAPFSGSIEEVPVKAGQFVPMGAQVAFLVSNSDMYINADVSEAYIGKFKVGDKVDVLIPSMNEEFTSTITSIGNVINPASRTFVVEVKLPKIDEYLKANLITIVKITDYKDEDALVIPSRIVQEDLQGNFVYKLAGGEAKKVHVTLGLSFNDKTEVKNGLSVGETVVDKGSRTIADGTKVNVQN